MLVTISLALGSSLASVALAASLYYLLYGTMQPVWGMLSDRVGRVQVMRSALLGACTCGVLSALAPNLPLLVAARALTGGFFAAVIPTSLVYIGDTVQITDRQRAMADLMAATAAGTALATAGAGIAATLGAWRLAFVLPAVAAGLLSLPMARLPEPKMAGGTTPLAGITVFLSRPWAVLVVLIVLVEGAVMLGFLIFLAPALEAGGYAPATAGLAIGLYGVAAVGWSRAVKRMSGRLGPPRSILLGGLMLTLGYGAASLDHGPVGVSLAAIFVAGCYAFMHSTLQTWATEVAPDARATVVSFFAAGLFVGSGVTASVAAPLAQDNAFALLFALAALMSIPLTLGASLARRAYEGAARRSAMKART
jgi:predicted MFS family arabinose efflux permease